jgi:hypothetical protein
MTVYFGITFCIGDINLHWASTWLFVVMLAFFACMYETFLVLASVTDQLRDVNSALSMSRASIATLQWLSFDECFVANAVETDAFIP